MSRLPTQAQAGFTLVEMIVSIVVLGVLLSLTSMFVRNQVETYADVARRTELADAADTAMRRMVRDLQAALPNSPRTPTADCVEFIPTKTGGRYRAESDGTAGSEFLDFSAADSVFNMYGPQSPSPPSRSPSAIWSRSITWAFRGRMRLCRTIPLQ